MSAMAAQIAAAVQYAAEAAAEPRLPVVHSETWDDGTTVTHLKSPFRQLPRPVELPNGEQVRRAVKRTVSLADLYGSQLTVTWNGLRKQRDDSHGLPLVVHSNGIDYIQDGHHRLTNELLAGQTHAKVRYVDLDRDD